MFLELWHSGYFVFIAVRGGGGTDKTQKAKRLNKEEIKKQLVDSMISSGMIENRRVGRKSWQSRETQGCCWYQKAVWRNPSHKKEGHYIYSVSSRKSV